MTSFEEARMTTESKSFGALFDAYLFRGLGLFVGWGGVAAMLVNNRWGHLLTSPYGLFFLACFVSMGVYSTWTVIADIRK